MGNNVAIIEDDQIIEACKILAKQENLKICLEESAKGAAIAELGSFLGGILGGRMGIAIGAAVGGAAGAMMVKDYKPLWEFIDEMTADEMKRLAKHMNEFLTQKKILTATDLNKLVENLNSIDREQLIQELGVFFGIAMTGYAVSDKLNGTSEKHLN